MSTKQENKPLEQPNVSSNLPVFKFRINHSNDIVKHEVVKETAARITFKKNRLFEKDKEYIDTENKNSSWHTWHDTFEDAKQYLINKTERRIEYLKQDLEMQNKLLQQYSSLSCC